METIYNIVRTCPGDKDRIVDTIESDYPRAIIEANAWDNLAYVWNKNVVHFAIERPPLVH